MNSKHNHHLNTVLSPDDMQDDFTRELLQEDFGFIGAKRLEDGTYVGLIRLYSTVAICIGVDRYSAYRRRYCYKDLGACLAAYKALQTGDDVPKGWIARRPEHPDDYLRNKQPPTQPEPVAQTTKKKRAPRVRSNSGMAP